GVETAHPLPETAPELLVGAGAIGEGEDGGGAARKAEPDPDLVSRGALGPDGARVGAGEGHVEELDRRAGGKDALALPRPPGLLLLQRATEEEGRPRGRVEVHADAGDGEPARRRGPDLTQDRL